MVNYSDIFGNNSGNNKGYSNKNLRMNNVS
jgi:hypothetical protein